MPQSLLSVLKTLWLSFYSFYSQLSKEDVLFLVVEVLNEGTSLSGVATVWLVSIARDITTFPTFETKTLSVSSVYVHGVGVMRCWGTWNGGLVVVLRMRRVSLEKASTGWGRRSRVGMVCHGEIDTRGVLLRCVQRTSLESCARLVMISCISFLGLFCAPLSVELDRFVLPESERGGDVVHPVDSTSDLFSETLMKEP